MRCAQDTGETVYQREFDAPKNDRTRLFLPFDTFRLVRGARTVAGSPPLSASLAAHVYQMSVVVSAFQMAETMTKLPNFRPGRFRLRLFELGAYAPDLAPARCSAFFYTHRFGEYSE